MRFRKLLGLLAIGGAVAYAHKKRGGEFTVKSLKSSLRDAVDKLQSKAKELRQQAASAAEQATNRAKRVGYDDDRVGGSNAGNGPPRSR